MMKILVAVLFLSLTLFAGMAKKLVDFDSLSFEDAFEKKIAIPKTTKIIIVSFDRTGSKLISSYFNEQSKGTFKKHDAIYIGDVSQMPSLITKMFARPKMQKYNFTTYMYYEENLQEYIPYKEDYVTVLHVSADGDIEKIRYENDAKAIFKEK